MGQMIKRGKELIRINSTNKQKIEYSTNEGKSWIHRFTANSTHGEFMELNDNGKEILVITSKGLFYSTNEGKSWIKRS
jgi:hypothetical protein